MNAIVKLQKRLSYIVSAIETANVVSQKYCSSAPRYYSIPCSNRQDRANGRATGASDSMNEWMKVDYAKRRVGEGNYAEQRRSTDVTVREWRRSRGHRATTQSGPTSYALHVVGKSPPLISSGSETIQQHTMSAGQRLTTTTPSSPCGLS